MIQSNWIAVRAFPFLLVGVGFCFVERVQSEDGKSHRPSEDLQFSQAIVGAGAAKPALSVFEALELTKKYIEQEGIDVSEQHVSSVILKDGREQAAPDQERKQPLSSKTGCFDRRYTCRRCPKCRKYR